jgi:hypothetical protein
VQSLSYFTGYTEHMQMREEAKKRWGAGFTLKGYNADAGTWNAADQIRARVTLRSADRIDGAVGLLSGATERHQASRRAPIRRCDPGGHCFWTAL